MFAVPTTLRVGVRRPQAVGRRVGGWTAFPSYYAARLCSIYLSIYSLGALWTLSMTLNGALELLWYSLNRKDLRLLNARCLRV